MKAHIGIVIGAIAAMTSLSASATRYWPTAALTEWDMYLNNGVVYITSPQFAGHCAYSRGQIDVNPNPYDRALYAYALSAKARGKALRYVIDDGATTCVIDALQEQ